MSIEVSEQVRRRHAADVADLERRGYTVGYQVGSDTRITRYLPMNGRRVTVEVFWPTERFGEPAPATVNWPSIGSVSGADAAEFADLLFEAGRLATALSAAILGEEAAR